MSIRYLPLFVYGTLLPGSRSFGSQLKPSVSESAPAMLPGADMYLGSSYPIAIPNRAGTGVVGEVLLLDERRFERLIADLDEQEGYFGEGREDNLYIRTVMRVRITDTTNWTGENEVSAYVYLGSPETREHMEADEMVKSPSGDWRNHAEEWAEATADDNGDGIWDSLQDFDDNGDVIPDEAWVDPRFVDDDNYEGRVEDDPYPGN